MVQGWIDEVKVAKKEKEPSAPKAKSRGGRGGIWSPQVRVETWTGQIFLLCGNAMASCLCDMFQRIRPTSQGINQVKVAVKLFVC